MSSTDIRKLQDELEDIKKLLILHLMKSGAGTTEIRRILKLNGIQFGKLVPLKEVKKYKNKASSEK
jgi:hypothetical protein